MELTIEQALQQGVAAHKEGNLQEAERLYHTILEAQPEHPDANHNLGVIAVSVDKVGLALPLFKTALEANPKIEKFWLSYIDALITENHLETVKNVLSEGKKMGLNGETFDSLESKLNQVAQSTPFKLPEKKKSLTLKERRKKISESKRQKKKAKNENANSVSPSQAQLNNLINYYKNGQHEEAETLALSITKQFPEHQLSWKVLGAIFGQTGRKSEAINAKQRATHLAPQDAEAHYNLGNTLQELGRLEEAAVSHRQAIALKADFAEAYSHLGATLQALGRLEESETSYSKAIELKSDDAEAYNNLGNVLKDLGRLEEAEVHFRRAIVLKADLAEAHNNLGATLQELGRLEEAQASYRQAIALKFDLVEAHQNLTRMKKFDKRDEQFLQMLALSLDESYSEEQHCHLSFALAKASEDLGDLESSFKYYCAGNALRKKLLNYDISQDIEIFKQLKTSYPKIEKKSLASENLSNKLTPIFIVGMLRSGTTLVEQIISSHSQVTGAGELHFASQLGDSIARGSTELDTDILLNFREKYLEKLQILSNGSPVVTDKMPQNFYYIGLLTAAFPDAKIVHVKRNSAAVCWGNFKQLFPSKSLGYCYGLDDIVAYYALYQNLMQFWGKKLPNKIYNLDYELLTTNQEDETKKLIYYLGLDWENQCLSPENNRRVIATASNTQVRKKVYQGSSQQWEKFQPFLKGVLDYLDD
jgi:tetratricopeptide (TPR) repeat protein